MPVTAVPPPAAGSVNPVELLASAVRVASGTGAEFTLAATGILIFEAILSAVTGGGSMTLYVQQSWDGTNWDDLWAVSLPVSGPNNPEIQSAAFPPRERDAAPESHLWQDAAMGAGVRNTTLARRFRTRWTIAVGSYTIQVLAHIR